MTFLTTRFGETDDNNSSTSTLTASSNYTGTATEVENYGIVTVNVHRMKSVKIQDYRSNLVVIQLIGILLKVILMIKFRDLELSHLM